MRLWIVFGCLLLSVPLAPACFGGDGGGDTDDDGGMETDGSPDEGDGAVDGGGDVGDAGFDAAFPDAAAGFPPRIQRVSVTHAPEGSCSVGTKSDVRVVVDADDPDPDTSPTDLIYSGTFDSCTGEIDAPDVLIECDEAGAMGGVVTVTDPEGHSDSLEIGFDACMDQSFP